MIAHRDSARNATTLRHCVFLMVCGLCCASNALGQSAILTGPEPRTIQLGQSATLQLARTPEAAEDLALSGLPTVDDATLSARRSGPGSWTITVTPRRTGTIDLPPILLVENGESLRVSPSHALEVQPDLVGAATGFIEVVPQREQAFVGEQLAVDIRFGVTPSAAPRLVQLFQRTIDAPFEVRTRPLLQLPPIGDTATIVWNEAITAVQRAEDAFVLRCAVTFAEPGDRELPGALLAFVLADSIEEDFLGNLRIQGRQEAAVASTPHTVQVMPWPRAGRPTGFDGPVGNFSMRASATPTSVNSGSTIRVRVILEGDSNLNSAPVPSPGTAPGLSWLGHIEENASVSRVYLFEVTPEHGDVAQIPPFEFAFFDPTPPGTYRTARTQPIELDVTGPPRPSTPEITPADSDPTVPVHDGAADLNLDDSQILGRQEDAEAIIADLKTPIRTTSTPRVFLWCCLLAPGLFAAVWWCLRNRRDRDRRDPSRRRARQAASEYRREARREGADDAALFSEYLAARLRTTPAAVAAASIERELQSLGLSSELASQAQSRLRELVDRRYATPQRSRLPEPTTQKLIGAMERGFQPRRGRAAAMLVLLALGTISATHGTQTPAGTDHQQGTPSNATNLEVASKLIRAAASAYDQQFFDAADAFYAEAATALGEEPAALLVARGHCAFRANRLSHALWFFERALIRRPDASDARVHAERTRAALDLNQDSGFFARVAALDPWWLGAFAVALQVLGVLGLLGRRQSKHPLQVVLSLIALCVGILLAVLLVANHGFEKRERAIALAPDTLVFAEPQDGSVVMAQLPAGTTLDVVRTSAHWVLTDHGAGQGWIAKDQLGLID